MNFRSSSKYFRVRVAIWSSVFTTLFSLFIAVKLFNESIAVTSELLSINPLIEMLIEDKLIYPLLLSLIFGFIAFSAILTYKEKHFKFDKQRWCQKGLKPKLEVISDWVIK